MGDVDSNATAALIAQTTEALQSQFAVTWILLCSFFVISMQLGFAMLEVGSVREAHRMTVLAKNIMDATVSCVAFWIFTQVQQGLDPGATDLHSTRHLMVFNWAFCATSVTICSGSMAERTHMASYLCYATVMAALIYPVVSTSAWTSRGLLSSNFHGYWAHNYIYHDFAGSGVVHVTGGVSALVGNLFLGRRIMRPIPGFPFPHAAGGSPVQSASVPQGNPMGSPSTSSEGAFLGGTLMGNGGIVSGTVPASAGDAMGRGPGQFAELADLEDLDEHRLLLAKPPNGWPRRFDSLIRDEVEFAPLNYLQVIGMFTLWIGWYGFNAGSTLCVNEACSLTAGKVAWNTTLAASSGGIGAYVFCYCVCRNLDSSVLCNGILSGLVAITACCDVCNSVEAILIGFAAAAIIYPASAKLLRWRLVDDPVDAIPVHCACGAFGVLATAFCTPHCAGQLMSEQARFCSADFEARWQILEQAWGLLTIVCWTGGISLVLWGFFAISELVCAQQARYFTLADNLLFQTLSADIAVDGLAEKWKMVASNSPIARRHMRQHGWTGACFMNGVPDDVFALRTELERARGEKVETSLEVGNGFILRCLVICLHRCRITRELAFWRLRLAPVSELSGLGAADMKGGTLLGVVRKLAEAQREARAVNSPLKEEVRELARAVQSQDLLLRSLWRRKNRGSHNLQALPSVREENMVDPIHLEQGDIIGDRSITTEGSPSPVSIGAPAGNGRSPARPPNVPQLWRSENSSSVLTDRTASTGALTPHSAHEATPPPSIIGLRGASLPSNDRSTGSDAEDVAAQLVSMMQAQQELMLSLTRASNNNILQGTDSSPHSMLVNALQQLAAQQQRDQLSPAATTNVSSRYHPWSHLSNNSTTGSDATTPRARR